MELSGQLHAQAALSLGKEPSVPIGQGVGGPQSRSGHSDEKNPYPCR